MRDSSNPSAWTLKDIEGDSAGYRAAQSASRQDRTLEEQKRQESLDRASFEAAFIKAGGTRAGAGDAYRAKRDQRASEAAAFADETARLAQRGATMWTV